MWFFYRTILLIYWNTFETRIFDLDFETVKLNDHIVLTLLARGPLLDVKIRLLKSFQAQKLFNIYNGRRPVGIQMKRKQLTKTFMMISNWKTLWSPMVYTKNVSGWALTLWPPNYSIGIFTHLKLCLADAIHNFKWVKIIQIWQNGSQQISNLAY